MNLCVVCFCFLFSIIYIGKCTNYKCATQFSQSEHPGNQHPGQEIEPITESQVVVLTPGALPCRPLALIWDPEIPRHISSYLEKPGFLVSLRLSHVWSWGLLSPGGLWLAHLVCWPWNICTQLMLWNNESFFPVNPKLYLQHVALVMCTQNPLRDSNLKTGN